MKKLILILASAPMFAQLNQTNIIKGFKTPEEVMRLFLEKNTLKEVKTIVIPVDQNGLVIKDSILIVDKHNQEIKRDDTEAFCAVVAGYVFKLSNCKRLINTYLINNK